MTQRMLADLGRLTLDFAALDDHVSWAYDILHPAGRKVAISKRPDSFKMRITNVRDFILSRAKKARLGSHPQVAEFLALLKELETIAHDRNLYVHGLITEVPEIAALFVSHQPRRGKARQEELTGDAIPALNNRISEASVSLVNLTLSVREVLTRAEAKQKGSARKSLH